VTDTVNLVPPVYVRGTKAQELLCHTTVSAQVLIAVNFTAAVPAWEVDGA